MKKFSLSLIILALSVSVVGCGEDAPQIAPAGNTPPNPQVKKNPPVDAKKEMEKILYQAKGTWKLESVTEGSKTVTPPAGEASFIRIKSTTESSGIHYFEKGALEGTLPPGTLSYVSTKKHTLTVSPKGEVKFVLSDPTCINQAGVKFDCPKIPSVTDFTAKIITLTGNTLKITLKTPTSPVLVFKKSKVFQEELFAANEETFKNATGKWVMSTRFAGVDVPVVPNTEFLEISKNLIVKTETVSAEHFAKFGVEITYAAAGRGTALPMGTTAFTATHTFKRSGLDSTTSQLSLESETCVNQLGAPIHCPKTIQMENHTIEISLEADGSLVITGPTSEETYTKI